MGDTDISPRGFLWQLCPEGGRGVVVALHGLNNSPRAMDDMAQVLADSGFHCLMVNLHGPQSSENVETAWVDLAAAGMHEARNRFPDLPLFNVSYSLGAVVTLASQCGEASGGYRAAVFLAPALSLTPGAAVIRWLAPLGALGLSLPSDTPEELRLRPATPLSEYRAMLRLMAAASQGEQLDRARHLPTRVLLDPDDELVSYAGVRQWMESRELKTWQLDAVSCTAGGGSHHLLISERYAGTTPWEQITNATIEHLDAYCH